MPVGQHAPALRTVASLESILSLFLGPQGPSPQGWQADRNYTHKKPPQLQPCNGRWLNGGGIRGVRPSGFTREGLRMRRSTYAVAGSESLPTHAGRLLVWLVVPP